MKDENTDTVTELTPHMTGRWLVTTSGSRHVWDMDNGTYTRMPGEGRGRFTGDGAALSIYAVRVYPRVGASFYVELDDPADPLQVQWRLSSTVERIEPLRDDEDEQV